MTKVVPWKDVRAEFGRASRLIGNGLSRSIWRPFEYGSLFQVANVNHRMRGNNQSLRQPRKLDKNSAPSTRAVHTFADLQAATNRWIEIYNRSVIPALGGSPKDLYERDLARAVHALAAPSRTRRASAPSPRSSPSTDASSRSVATVSRSTTSRTGATPS
jgi:hypothetical protein